MKKLDRLYRKNFRYEEDDYDRLQHIESKKKWKNCFTNRSTMNKFEYDYEEDAYEPDRDRE